MESRWAPNSRWARNSSAIAAATASAFALALGVGATGVAAAPDASDGAGTANQTIVFVVDGLRPDSVNAKDTPNLVRLRRNGVNYLNSHAAVPTVTRVNSSVIGSGSYPSRTGIVGNSMFVQEFDPFSPFSTGEANNLTGLDDVSGGRLIFVKTLAERLHAQGLSLAAVGSGSSGSTLLLNPRAPRGIGYMINAGDEEGVAPFAYPESIGEEITERFGPPPSTQGQPNKNAKVNYAQGILRDYVLPELQPDVILNWITEPDGTQHRTGAGSPESIATIRNSDRQIGLVLDRLDELGLAEDTNVMVLSDHGFSLKDFNVNLTQELIAAGLKASPTSNDVVVANSGTSLVHVKDRDPAKIKRIVAFLQQQPWADTLYTATKQPRDGRYVRAAQGFVRPRGWVPGTFSLELIHEANPERGADIVLTYPWTSRRNQFGVRGTSGSAGGGATGPSTGPGSGHGSFSPWDIRNTMLAWGPDFKDGRTISTPAGNVDIAPTILALAGVDDGLKSDGRVLSEALEEGVDQDDVPARTRTFNTRAGDYRATVTVSEVRGGRYRYVDKSSRIPSRSTR
jgi:predicted AlkP superfamily pyrophosphatase or phosphodiesterase